MKKVKKLVSILLVLTMILALAGCGSKSAADSLDEAATDTVSEETTTTEETTTSDETAAAEAAELDTSERVDFGILRNG